jgi:hypothetical protein
VLFGTVSGDPHLYTRQMQLESIKALIVGAWVLGVGAIALSVNLTSPAGWSILVGLGLLPPIILLRMWQQPEQTTSERIREAIR